MTNAGATAPQVAVAGKAYAVSVWLSEGSNEVQATSADVEVIVIVVPGVTASQATDAAGTLTLISPPGAPADHAAVAPGVVISKAADGATALQVLLAGVGV